MSPGGELPVELGRRLVDWYRDNARDLPWRRTDEPYGVLVSEVMLQQTRVETVRDRWAGFLERFPDLESLAAATEDEVLAAWSGLGYYRRARSLRRLARRLVQRQREEQDGSRPSPVTVPSRPEDLRELPGVGPYTAAAVASIAFGRPALALDGNVARVLCRLLALDDEPRRAPVVRELESRVAGWLEALPPGDANQALMELGATVCSPRSPRCHECPLTGDCTAERLGIQERLPPTRRTPVEDVTEAGVVIERQGRYLLFRGQRPGVLQTMWEFPTLDSRLASRVPTSPSEAGPAGRLAGYLRTLGFPVRIDERLGDIRHGITSRRIRCHLFQGSLPETAETPLPAPPESPEASAEPAAESPRAPHEVPRPESGWFAPSEVGRIPLAASTRKVFEDVLDIDVH